MTVRLVDNSEADRIGMAIAERLGLDPERILSGSLRWEFTGGEDQAQIRWDGFATMDVSELLAIVNDMPRRDS